MSLKKPLGLGLSIGVMAMMFGALPASATAAPKITSPAGTTVPVKTTLIATSTNLTFNYSPAIGSLSCRKAVVYGMVTANSGTHVHIEMDGANDKATECTLNGVPVTVQSTLTALDMMPTEKSATFDFTWSGRWYESSTATVTCNAGGGSIHVSGPLTGTQSGILTADFAAVTAAGKAVTWDC